MIKKRNKNSPAKNVLSQRQRQQKSQFEKMSLDMKYNDVFFGFTVFITFAFALAAGKRLLYSFFSYR